MPDPGFLQDLISAAEQIVFETTGQHVFRDGHTGAFTEAAGRIVQSAQELANAREDSLTLHLWDEGIVRPEAAGLEAVRAILAELGLTTEAPSGPKRIFSPYGSLLNPDVARRPGRRWTNPFQVIPAPEGRDGYGVILDPRFQLGRTPGPKPEFTPTVIGTSVYDTANSFEQARTIAVRLFGLHLGPMGSIELDSDTRDKLVAELGGKDLACNCPIGAPCHVDVLLEHANQER